MEKYLLVVSRQLPMNWSAAQKSDYHYMVHIYPKPKEVNEDYISYKERIVSELRNVEKQITHIFVDDHNLLYTNLCRAVFPNASWIRPIFFDVFKRGFKKWEVIVGNL